ncbi:MAG: serine hydrolase [Paracoccus sp. (in: a-proteobacteria)]|uniref:serine hydrolase domain-containing protein n=1 Tax=Paracoccus sp. TaxID=267 RepID=UPI0026DFA4A8|nr:serine hydrolase [Paracoccus sp. (in: a-proteobacteria)]MDO5612918.1 serine hydrolase [Paracoccus sp. (in: a-proteobacteria)]
MPNRRRFLILAGAATVTTLATPMLAQGAASRGMDAAIAQAARLDQFRTLVIHQNGQRVFAQAFRGPAPDRPANVKSVSKTILALLTGIAIDRGVITGPDQRVLPLLGHAGFGDARDRLTIGNLLTMQTGLSSTSGGNYGAWVSSRDWVATALAQPAGQPGGRFIYSTGGWHVLGAALARASGQSLHAMAQNWLGNPLDIRIPPWVADPQGRYLGGNDMAISPLGLARIGDMVLAGGRMGDRQIVSRDWIAQSWQSRTRSPFSGDSYGYGWFLTRYAGQPGYYARGYGGQMLALIPTRGLSVAITSDPNRPARGDGYFGDLRRLVDQIAA